MFDNLHIIDTLRAAGFETGEITVNPEPGVRDVTISDAGPDPARVLAKAGYDVLCYGSGLGGPAVLATLIVALPKASVKAA